MFEPLSDAKFADDGCAHLTGEQMQAFSEMVTPAEFDVTKAPKSHLDIRYGVLPEQTLDVYLPEAGEAPFPVVFYVHGGGWVEGTKTLCPLDGIIGVTKRGYAVVSVNYRLAPGVTFPEFLFDVKTAVRWGRAMAGEYGFDPRRFAMAGDSAGGYLVLMAAFTSGRPEYAGEQYGFGGYSDEIQAVCDLYGPTILAKPMIPFYLESGVPRAMYDIEGEPTFFDLAFGTDNENLLDLISPVNHVHKAIPPVLIMHGIPDGIIPYQHSKLLFEKIGEVCGEGRAELILYEDRNHADFGFNTDENAAVMAAFFDRHLK